MRIKPDSGPVLAPVRPRVSLRCGPWNAHEECPGDFCGCPCHELADAGEGGSGER